MLHSFNIFSSKALKNLWKSLYNVSKCFQLYHEVSSITLQPKFYLVHWLIFRAPMDMVKVLGIVNNVHINAVRLFHVRLSERMMRKWMKALRILIMVQIEFFFLSGFEFWDPMKHFYRLQLKNSWPLPFTSVRQVINWEYLFLMECTSRFSS